MELKIFKYKETRFLYNFFLPSGNANFTLVDLKKSFKYCNNVIYGYVGFNADTFDIKTLHPLQKSQFEQVKKLKTEYRHIKFLLSLGGDKDLDKADKYIKLLEASDSKQEKFIKSAKKFLKKYKFDGLDLSYQFSRNKTKSKSVVKSLLKKGTIIAKAVINKKPTNLLGKTKSLKKSHTLNKHQFTVLVNKLKNSLKRERLLLSLTVLPHVNVTGKLKVFIIIVYM